MKKLIKCICLFLLTTLLASAIAPIALIAAENDSPAPGELPFKDVAKEEWCYEFVKSAYKDGLIEGKTPDTFAPSENTTRAQIVTILYRLARAEDKGLGENLTFTDTPKNEWYADYLGWAKRENLVDGYPEGDFRPNKSVTREELAKLIVGFLKYISAEPELNPQIDEFSDKNEFPSWSAPYIEELRKTGFINGYEDNKFHPERNATRAEIAKLTAVMSPCVKDALEKTEAVPPIMGWSSYNCFGLGPYEQILIETMDAMVDKGLLEAGYEYVNIDDGWTNGRDETTGRVNVHEERFPHGMKYIADEAHKRGLKAGIYSDVGYNTCGGTNPDKYGFSGEGVGLYEHAADDLWRYLGDGVYEDTYAKKTGEAGVECWGFDFIKVDSDGTKLGVNAAVEHPFNYNIILDIEKATGKDKIYNMCRWYYDAPYLLKVGDSFRTGADISANWDSISSIIEKQKRVGMYTIPGHYGDPDMLEVGNGQLTPEENRSHFAMWCMFASPLVLGCDVRNISDATVELVTNEELIAINQDPVGRSAAYIETLEDSIELWLKRTVSMDTGNAAIALYNTANEPKTVTLNLSDICKSGKAEARDAINHADLGEISTYTVTLAAHDTVVLTMNTDEGFHSDCYEIYGEIENIEYDVDVEKEYEINPENDTIDAETAKKYIANRVIAATLIDVRSAKAYAEGHLEKAINVEYNDVVTGIDKLPMDQKKYLIIYSDKYDKHLLQAYYQLKMLRYENVYILDSMNDY